MMARQLAFDLSDGDVPTIEVDFMGVEYVRYFCPEPGCEESALCDLRQYGQWRLRHVDATNHHQHYNDTDADPCSFAYHDRPACLPAPLRHDQRRARPPALRILEEGGAA